MSKLLKKLPLCVLLLPLFFCLHGAAENFGIIPSSTLVNLCFHILSALTIVFIVLWFFTKKLAYAGIITFSLSAWYLFFGAIVDWVKTTNILKFADSFSWIFVISLAIIIGLLVIIRKKTEVHGRILFFLNILLIVYCLYDAVLISNMNINIHKPVATSIHPFDSSLVKQKPNVYYLVFDEYPGRKGLIDSFAFNNDSLYSFFKTNEFKELPVFSNYNFTFYSMPSIFNMQYVSPLVHPLAIQQEDYQARRDEMYQAKVVNCFEAMDYRIYNLSFFDIETPARLDGFHIDLDQSRVITDKIFHNRALANYGRMIVLSQYNIPFIKEYFMAANTWNTVMEATLRTIPGEASRKPKFTYAHLFLPHFPLFYDSAGKHTTDAVMLAPPAELKNEDILSYIKYTNTKIISIVNELIAKEPQAIIVVMSDHGLRYYDPAMEKEPLFFDNICFARFPDKNYLPFKDKWSNVNFFPYLFNCEFNQHIPYLPDSTILIADKVLENQFK